MNERVEILIDRIRRDHEIINPTRTDSISDLEILGYLGEGQEQIFMKVIGNRPDLFVEPYSTNLVANQETYAIPNKVFLNGKILRVEYINTSGFPNRLPILHGVRGNPNSPSSIPASYYRENNLIYVNPIPSTNQTNGLRITYQRQPRTLDLRRGKIKTATVAGGYLTGITLELSSLLPKDNGTRDAAIDGLNLWDYICIVDRDGQSLLDNIAINEYNQSTGVITLPSPGTATTLSAGAFTNAYIVAGDFATSHCELPRTCIRYLQIYARLQLAIRDGLVPIIDALTKTLAAQESTIAKAFEEMTEDNKPLVPDEQWFNYDG